MAHDKIMSLTRNLCFPSNTIQSVDKVQIYINIWMCFRIVVVADCITKMYWGRGGISILGVVGLKQKARAVNGQKTLSFKETVIPTPTTSQGIHEADKEIPSKT